LSIFVTAAERLSRPATVNIAIVAPFGRGKTFQITKLPPEETLAVDIEAGLQSIGGCPVTSLNVMDLARKLDVHPWQVCRAIACIVSGYKSAVRPDDPYSKASYDQYCAAIGGHELFAGFKYIFWDSITVASRLCFEWVKTLPESYSEKTGKLDTRAVYGKVGQELREWITIIQHTPEKSTIMAVAAKEETDDLNKKTWKMIMDGTAGADALKGVFDQMLFLDHVNFPPEQGGPQRVFVCSEVNPQGYPVKSRGGFLEYYEPADIGHVIRKIQAGIRGQSVGSVARVAPEMPKGVE
jgi:hypothetical protein